MTLRRKRKAEEPFSLSRYWAGLLFRLGEAVLFTFVMFLLFITYRLDAYEHVLEIALFIGMYIKTGERLMAGLADRVFAAAAALVASSNTQDESAPPSSETQDKRQR